MLVIVVIVLVFTVLALGIYNLSLYKRIQSFQTQNRRFTNLNILQDFMNITGSDLSVDKKIKSINDIIIEKYQIKYSTIVVFDGTDYVVKASNVNSNHWDTLSKLHEVNIFKDSISTASPKYITINNEGEKLPYQEKEFDRAKSAIFFPLYIDNVYIGYWIIESGVPHDFDNIDTTIFEVVKENIVSVLRTVVHQKTLESIVRKDLFTGLYSEEYLYGEGKKVIDKYTTSTVCMYRITNIEEINDKYSRKLGNQVIIETSDFIRKSISNDYIYIRYMGPKFVIVFSGVDIDSVTTFITDMKNGTEELEISLPVDNEVEEVEMDAVDRKNKKKNKKEQEPQVVKAKLNFVLTTYYKGTGMEEVLKKLEQYVDNCDKSENDITFI